VPAVGNGSVTRPRPELVLGDSGDREDAGAFVARVARMDGQALVRLRSSPAASPDSPSRVQLWATTPFDALVTRSVAGTVTPADVTVHAANLLPGLAVARSQIVDPGPPVDALWRTQLPPLGGWSAVDVVPAAVIADLTATGTTAAQSAVSPVGGTSTALLDQTVLTVSGAGYTVTVPMRCLFALSGMGFAGEADVTVYATDAWLRLDARFGAVVRRRHSLLPLVF
jgi:hypothetical protein